MPRTSAPWQGFYTMPERRLPRGNVTSTQWIYFRTHTHRRSITRAQARTCSCVAQEPGRLIIEGHHGGIPNFHEGIHEPERTAHDDEVRAVMNELFPDLSNTLTSGSVLPASWADWATHDVLAFEMGTRLVHSTLVDADYLDTAAHFNDTAPQVAPATDFTHLNEIFHDGLNRELSGRRASPVDLLRASLLDQCLTAASMPRGVYRLPAPTGSGKTISAAAFAIAHAAHHQMSRVIVAVPFLSITQQNAAVYRRLLGDEYVLEHHSGIESLGDQRATNSGRLKCGSENWDSPFVITTTIQLFESLFSNRPARTRKLHRLANSVIVLDEVQAIPPRVLPVILDGLRILQQHFGATVVMSSATQPAWESVEPWRGAAMDIRSIVSDPAPLYANLRRASIEWTTFPDLGSVAERVVCENAVMAIVNTTSNARDLARLVAAQDADGVLHLSTRMYAAHRHEVLSEVRRRLDEGLPVRLVSTQLVEAGVDVDFPVVLRSLAPAENLIQARGRCNREGQLSIGQFIVAECPDLTVLDAYETGVSMTERYFRTGGGDLDDPETVHEYYGALFDAMDPDNLAEAIRIRDARKYLRYREAAQFRMIADETRSVVVASAPGASEALARLIDLSDQRAAPPPERFRELQKFTATLPQRLSPSAQTYITEDLPGVSVWRGRYDTLTGVQVDVAGPQDSVW